MKRASGACERTTVVVLPTYNEIANFRTIAMEILSLSPSIRLLVIDNASPAGTGEEAERLAASSRHVTVIRRGGKLGLGSAYRQAFQMILKHTDADLKNPWGISFGPTNSLSLSCKV